MLKLPGMGSFARPFAVIGDQCTSSAQKGSRIRDQKPLSLEEILMQKSLSVWGLTGAFVCYCCISM